MLAENVTEFISRSMKIDLESVFKKLNEDRIKVHQKELFKAIENFAQAILNQAKSGVVRDPLSFEDSPAEVAINQYSSDLAERFTNEDAKAALDSLRHAFCSFAFGGLHQLFTHQENESWYPKIILDEELKPNDIESLTEDVKIYRGTDLAEFNSKNYGQSWTTSKNVASDFAFRHYVGQDWFEASQRLILCAHISKRNVYFSDQSREFEIVVDVSKLAEMQRCK